jgi:CRP-like cAMP-binding protein
VRHREQRQEAIEGVEIFKSLTGQELEQLAQGIELLPFSAGETITRQGAVAHWLYILTRGQVEIRANLEDGSTKRIATLEAPSFFGEMGLMTGAPRTADVIAVTDCDCYRLGKSTFEEVILRRPELVTVLSARLAERRLQLLSALEGLDDEAKRARRASEEQQILRGIKSFFGL